MRTGRICLTLIAAIFFAAPTLAGDTVYVDLSGIDTGFPGLSAAERQQLKDLIIADIQANFTVAGVDITVTTDAGAAADRTVNIVDDMGTHTRSDGSTGHHYGEWAHGSDSVNVHLDNFTDRHGDDYKTDGAWDLDKLRKGIGRTAAHEVAHSYSVGHNDSDPPNKMTKGGLVSSSTRANTEWIFDSHTSEVLKKNLGKKPCKSSVDYDQDWVEPVFYSTPTFPNDMDEFPGFDALLLISGPLAAEFNLGWLGDDSDGGLLDGDPQFDFIYKASAAEPNQPTALALLSGHHDTIQWVLQGRIGSPWEGQWFRMNQADIVLSDPITNPASDQSFRVFSALWDIDGDTLPDYILDLDTLDAYPPYGAQSNGFRMARAWPCPADVNRDGQVDLSDLAQVLANFGSSGAVFADGDTDLDGDVDLSDLAAVLGAFGQTCAPVLAGIDCLNTQCDGTTTYQFADDPIPADFFGPGSQPFDGIVELGGFGSGADTRIERLGDMVFGDNLPQTGQVQIELVQLDLVGCQPITVQELTGTSQWDVAMGLSQSPAPQGTMTVTKQHENGGTFRAEFLVQPVFTFTNVGDPSDVRVFDTAAEGIPPIQMSTIGSAPWSTDESLDTCTIDGFAPGVATDPVTGVSCCGPVAFASLFSNALQQTASPPNCAGCP